MLVVHVRGHGSRLRDIRRGRQTLEEVLLKVEDLSSSEAIEVPLLSILPPLVAILTHVNALLIVLMIFLMAFKPF